MDPGIPALSPVFVMDMYLLTMASYKPYVFKYEYLFGTELLIFVCFYNVFMHQEQVYHVHLFI